MSDGLNDTRTDGPKDQADALLSLVAEQDARIKALTDMVAQLVPAHMSAKAGEPKPAPVKEEPYFVSKAGRKFSKESYERWRAGISTGIKAAHAKRAESAKRAEVRPAREADPDNGFLHVSKFAPADLNDFSAGETRVYAMPKGLQSLTFIEDSIARSRMKFDYRTAFLVMHEPDSHSAFASTQFSAPTARTVILVRRLA